MRNLPVRVDDILINSRSSIEATNGLIRPEVGGYVSGTSDRLPVYSAEGTRLDDDYGLPSLKIVRTDPAPRPQQVLGARFGDQIELLGYTLDPAEVALHPGEQLTVTLFFQTQAPIDDTLIRFVQLYSPELGMAAQQDSQPASGRNPTWAWKAGEIIVDEVVLTIAPDAKPGRYTLLLGFYMPTDGMRLPAQDQGGSQAADQVITLSKITVLTAKGDSEENPTRAGADNP